jgi:hypothetical protein
MTSRINVGGALRTYKEFAATGPYYKCVFAYNEVFCHTVLLKDNVLCAVLQCIGLTENAPKYE